MKRIVYAFLCVVLFYSLSNSLGINYKFIDLANTWENTVKLNSVLDYLENNKQEVITSATNLITGSITTTNLITGSITTTSTISVSTITATNTITANEVISTYGFICYRGDVALYDFDNSYWTKDSGYHDLDLSSIVPAGAKMVLLEVTYGDDSATTSIFFKKKGYTNLSTKLISWSNTQGHSQVWVGCDTNRVIQYYITTGFNTVLVHVAGWSK